MTPPLVPPPAASGSTPAPPGAEADPASAIDPPLDATSPAAGFDAMADRYDADERDNPAFAYLRARSYQRLLEAFGTEARLLEVGSGTGTEAARLAERGATLALADVSPRLLAQASAKVRAARSGALLGADLLAARRLAELGARYGQATFDGAYSSLGPLNCEPDLGPVAAGLAALVRPGGAVVLSVMNRACAVETLWFAAHRQWRQAARRWGGGPVWASAFPGGPADVRTWYHGPGAIARAFAADFSIELIEALPLFWPPTTLGFLVQRFPRAFAALGPIDRGLGRWPLFRSLGDHLLVRLRRR